MPDNDDNTLVISSWDQMSDDPLPEGVEVVFAGQVLDDIIAGRMPPMLRASSEEMDEQ